MVEYDYEQINKQELIWEDNNMSRLGMLYALNEEDVLLNIFIRINCKK